MKTNYLRRFGEYLMREGYTLRKQINNFLSDMLSLEGRGENPSISPEPDILSLGLGEIVNGLN